MNGRFEQFGCCRDSQRGIRAFLLCCLSLSLLCSGCSRAFWRKQADRDTYSLLEEKTFDARWNVPRLDIEADPRSRFHDLYNLDESPLPPDDPAAHEYMHQLGGMSGYKKWHEIGTAMSIENPCWLEAFGISEESLDEQGNIVGPVPKIENLTLIQAIELAYIHSRDYQTAIEDLYLTALALTFDRFQFDVRYLGLGGREPTSNLTHTSVRDGTNSLEWDNRFGISRLLPSGGQWILELANNTIWLFQGRNSMSTASVVSYSLVQPLLLGAGRKVVLEDLTQQERNVLYSARDLARFRKQFFTDTVGGVGNGFLGLLAQQQNVRNRRNNVRQLEEQLELIQTIEQARPREISEPLERIPAGFQIPADLANRLRIGRGVGEAELKEGEIEEDAPGEIRLYWRGLMTEAQEQRLRGLSEDPAFLTTVEELISVVRSETKTLTVAQLETRLADSRINLSDAERGYQDLLDRFKIQLGLPPDMQISIEESLLKQFELIDPRLLSLTEQIKIFVNEWAKLDEEAPDFEQVQSVLAGLKQLSTELQRDGFDLVADDIRRVGMKLEGQQSGDRAIVDRERVVADVERDIRLFAGLKKDFSNAGKELKRLSALAGRDDLTAQQKSQLVFNIATLREKIMKISQGLQAVQIGQRVELISQAPFAMSQDAVVATALDNRLDLMNTRAEVMDARRAVEVAANRLEAVLDLRIEGDIRTPAGIRPLEFRGDQSSFRAGVQFTAPLDQIAERNDYRAALVTYQRARRNYMAAEDNVKFQVRQSWRQLSVLKGNFETARQGVRSAALQLDLNVEESTKPVGPGQAQRSGSRGLDILEALDAVLSQQNSLISIWVRYEQNRLSIYRDMGIMEIDDRGIWTDDVYQRRAEITQNIPTGAFIDGPISIGSDEFDRGELKGELEPRILRTGFTSCRPARLR